MVSILRTCYVCKSENIVLNGKNKSGNQRYRCKACGVTRVLDYVHQSRHVDMEAIARTYQERSGFR